MESAAGTSAIKIENLETTKRVPKFWAVGGGKGGVGKTLISTNFSISLAKMGREVLAIDLDLGGANLHTCLGVDPPEYGIGDWVVGRKKDLNSIIIATPQTHLSMIAGSNDPVKITSLMVSRRDELLQQLRNLNYDDIIIDLGAGTADLTVDFFIAADHGILTILPEPTSVENAYRFLRTAFFKKLSQSKISDDIKEIIDAATDHKNILGIKTPSDLLLVIDRMDPKAGEMLRADLETLKTSVVINQVRNQMDIDVGKAISSVCKRYFGVDVNYAAYLDYDNTVWKSVRSRKPLLHEFPHSTLADRLQKMTLVLTGKEKSIYP